MVAVVKQAKQAATRSVALILALVVLALGLAIAASPADAQDTHSASQATSSNEQASLDLSPWLTDSPIKRIYFRHLGAR